MRPDLTDTFSLVDSFGNELISPQINQYSNSKRHHAEASRITTSKCYWYLPNRFLGNKLASYGGAIQLNLMVDGNTRRSDEPDIEISGNGLKMSFTSSELYLAKQIRANLADGHGWKIGEKNATRNEIMKILSGINSIIVRACTGTYTAKTTIDQV